jgi:hypothetical protein
VQRHAPGYRPARRERVDNVSVVPLPALALRQSNRYPCAQSELFVPRRFAIHKETVKFTQC